MIKVLGTMLTAMSLATTAWATGWTTTKNIAPTTMTRFTRGPDGTLYAIGLNSTVFTSTNNGVNWTALPGTPPADTNYTSVSISSSGMFFGTNQVNGGVFSYASGAFTKFT